MHTRLRVSTALVAMLSCVGALVVGMSTPAAAVAADQFAWPATGHTDAGDVAWHQTHENGSRAVDIQAPLGTEVSAAQPGVVTVAFNGCANSNSQVCGDGFGNHVVVRHDRAGVSNPLYTLYAHLNSSLNVSVGASVNLGQTLGVIAMSGRTDGPHTHFAISVCATVWWGDSCTIWRGPDTASTTVYKGDAVPGSYPELVGSSSTPPRLSAVQYNNELSVFKRGGDKAIWKNTWQPANNAWSGWSSMEGVLAGDPTAIVYSGGLHVFAVADNGQLVQKYWNGSVWSGWVSLGGNIASDPTAMQYNNEMIVWGTNYANTTDKNTWNGMQWSGFTVLP